MQDQSKASVPLIYPVIQERFDDFGRAVIDAIFRLQNNLLAYAHYQYKIKHLFQGKNLKIAL